MPTETNQLPERGLKAHSPSICYPENRWPDEGICSRIRSLLLSRNYNFPPRTPFSSDERLNTFSDSHISKSSTGICPLNFPTNTISQKQKDSKSLKFCGDRQFFSVELATANSSAQKFEGFNKIRLKQENQNQTSSLKILLDHPCGVLENTELTIRHSPHEFLEFQPDILNTSIYTISEPMDTFPHAIQSSSMISNKTEDPSYSTTVATNFSLSGMKDQPQEFIGESSKLYKQSLNRSVCSDTSNDEIRRGQPDLYLRPKQKSPSLLSATSKKSVRHGLLKPSQKDNRPVDMGLAIPPIISPISSCHDSKNIGITHASITGDSFSEISHSIQPEMERPIMSKSSTPMVMKPPVEANFPLPLFKENSPTSDLDQSLPQNKSKGAEPTAVRNRILQPSIKLFEISHMGPTSVKKPSIQKIVSDRSGNRQTGLSEADRVKTIENYENNATRSANISTEISGVDFSKDPEWDPTTQSLRSEPQSISENVPSKYEASWWEGGPCRRLITGDRILLPRNSGSGNSRHQEDEIFGYYRGDDIKFLRRKNINGNQNAEIYSNEEPSYPKVSELVSLPFDEKSFPQLEKQNKKNNWNKAALNGYEAVPSQDTYNTRALDILSSQNTINMNHSSLKNSRGKDSNRIEPEIHSVSSVESSKSEDPANIDHNPANPQSFGLHGTDNAEPSLKNTVAWLKNIIPSNSPLENSIASLTRRARRGQNYHNLLQSNTVPVQVDEKSSPRKLSIPLELIENSEQNKPLKSRFDHSTGTDVSETLANTINDLEVLMKEAILLAQQAGQCQDSAHVLSVLSNDPEALKNNQINNSQLAEKTSSVYGAHQNLQSHSGGNLTYQKEESLTINPAANNKISIDDVKDDLSGSKPEFERPLAGHILTPYPPVPHKLSNGDSEKLKFEYHQSNLMQSREGTSRNGIAESSNIPSANIYINNNISLTNNPELLCQQPLRHRNTMSKRKCSSVSPRQSRSSRSRKGFIDNSTGSKLSDIHMVSVNQVSPGHSQVGSSYFHGEPIDRLNQKYDVAQDLKRSTSLINHSGVGSASTCSDVVNFSAGFGMNYHVLGVANESRSLRGNEISEKKDIGFPRPYGVGYKKDLSLSGKSYISLKNHHFKEFSLAKSHKRQTIARDWSPGRKRLVATVSCISTSLIGILVGIYSGETPAIQYYIADLHHYTVLGNVLFFIGLAIPTFFAWPLPLLHGRKPYILGSLSIAMPLLFPQALVVGDFRSPDESIWRVGLLLPRAIMGFCLGFANMNFKCMLTDLFGASLQSSNPHQEHADEFDVRRHGGGMGIWLGLWTWSTLGSIGLGFFIGSIIIETLPPSWGFYISIIIISFVMFLNVVCPEVRRSTYRRSMAEVLTRDTISRRLARGEVKMHMVKRGPKWWGEELHYGIKLSRKMMRQPGFLIMSLYVAWVYGQQFLITLLLGALISKDYNLSSPFVGVGVMAIAFGALIAIPFQKASLFSRSRRSPPVDDDGTLSKKKLHWSSHMLRRTIFVLCLPMSGLLITLIAGGPPVPFILPILVAGIIGFLSGLAMAECLGIIMETFDTSDLDPGMIGHPRGLSDNKKGVKRTNYSSYPRVCSAFAITETFGYIVAAGVSGISGVLTRHLGQQAAISVMTGILFILSLLLICILIRFTEVQIIPDSKMDEMNHYQARRASKSHLANSQIEDDEPWRPIIIGNPHQSTRRMCLLELGLLSRFSEIRMRNKLIDEMNTEVGHPNRNAINFLERKIKEKEVEIMKNLRQSFSRGSRSSQINEDPAKRDASGYRGILSTEIESRGDQGLAHQKIVTRKSKILE